MEALPSDLEHELQLLLTGSSTDVFGAQRAMLDAGLELSLKAFEKHILWPLLQDENNSIVHFLHSQSEFVSPLRPFFDDLFRWHSEYTRADPDASWPSARRHEMRLLVATVAELHLSRLVRGRPQGGPLRAETRLLMSRCTCLQDSVLGERLSLGVHIALLNKLRERAHNFRVQFDAPVWTCLPELLKCSREAVLARCVPAESVSAVENALFGEHATALDEHLLLANVACRSASLLCTAAYELLASSLAIEHMLDCLDADSAVRNTQKRLYRALNPKLEFWRQAASFFGDKSQSQRQLSPYGFEVCRTLYGSAEFKNSAAQTLDCVRDFRVNDEYGELLRQATKYVPGKILNTLYANTIGRRRSTSRRRSMSALFSGAPSVEKTKVDCATAGRESLRVQEHDKTKPKMLSQKQTTSSLKSLTLAFNSADDAENLDATPIRLNVHAMHRSPRSSSEFALFLRCGKTRAKCANNCASVIMSENTGDYDYVFVELWTREKKVSEKRIPLIQLPLVHKWLHFYSDDAQTRWLARAKVTLTNTDSEPSAGSKSTKECAYDVHCDLFALAACCGSFTERVSFTLECGDYKVQSDKYRLQNGSAHVQLRFACITLHATTQLDSLPDVFVSVWSKHERMCVWRLSASAAQNVPAKWHKLEYAHGFAPAEDAVGVPGVVLASVRVCVHGTAREELQQVQMRPVSLRAILHSAVIPSCDDVSSLQATLLLMSEQLQFRTEVHSSRDKHAAFFSADESFLTVDIPVLTDDNCNEDIMVPVFLFFSIPARKGGLFRKKRSTLVAWTRVELNDLSDKFGTRVSPVLPFTLTLPPKPLRVSQKRGLVRRQTTRLNLLNKATTRASFQVIAWNAEDVQ